MFRVRTVGLAVLAVSLVALFGASAGASIPASNTKFCTAASKIGSRAGSATSKSSPATLKALAKSINSAAASAPAKIKSAMHSMASYLQSVAAGKQPTDGQQYAKAAVAFSTYLAKTCTGVTP
jgi:hypothetical protein